MSFQLSNLVITFLFSVTTISGFAQLTNGLTAHFPFNGNLSDVSPSGIIGTEHGSVFVNDRNGNLNSAIEFSGPSTYYTFSDAAVKTELPITMSVWLKINSLDEAIYFIFMSDCNADNYAGFWMNLEHEGKIGIGFSGNLGGTSSVNRRSYTSSKVLSIGQWYHVVAVIKAYNDMSVYIDCEKTAGAYHGSGSTTIAYTTAESRIGSFIKDNRFLDGDLDDMAIWDRELSAGEIDQLCAGALALKEQLVGPTGLQASIYPNPSAGNMLVSVEGEPQEYTISVYDPAGKLVMSVPRTVGNKFPLDFTALSSQTYIVEINGISGTIRLKVVK